MSELERKPLFETLDPPPGGLARLRTRIREERRRRVLARTLAGALAAAVVVAVAILALPRAAGHRGALPGIESELLAVPLGLTEAPAEVVSIRPDLRRRYAVTEIPTGDDRVVMYLVGSR